VPDYVPDVIGREGKPKESRRRFMWMPLVVRVVALAWAVTIAIALIDAFKSLPQLPFLTAMGMTVLLVVVTFIVTRDGVPDWRGDPVRERTADDQQHATDLLTQLPTFNHFQQRIGDAAQRSRGIGKPFSVVLVDVNNVTAVNKEYGVGAGDEVLRHVAKAVDGTRRYNDIVARLGDDEFGVLLVDCSSDGVRAFVDRLEDRLSRESAQVEVNGRAVSLWAGICTGAATSGTGLHDPDGVLRAAMDSLDRAKADRERRRRMWLSA
jgi:diguanylate cyclase (GGDEF)-like protein